MKIPPFIEVRNNIKKRYYLFEPVLFLSFPDSSELKIIKEETAIRILVYKGSNYLEIAGAKRKELLITNPIFLNFMNSELFFDNFENNEEAEASLFNSTGLCFTSKIMKKTYTEVVKQTRNEDILFIYGETGTGKELIAKNIHYNSNRRDQPFTVISASSFFGNRIECELFGSVKGAYTNSEDTIKGAFIYAGKGTLVIDDLENISMDVQSKLLRALEYNEIKPVGSDKTKKHNARIIILSAKSPTLLLKENKIRSDLFYRIEKYKIEIPPLRQRTEDIIPLTDFFTNNAYKLSKDAVFLLKQHSWPGNVRELKNCIERAMFCSKNKTIDMQNILIRKIEETRTCSLDKINSNYMKLENELIKVVLDINNKNVSKSSKDLGLARGTLISKINKYGLLH